MLSLRDNDDDGSAPAPPIEQQRWWEQAEALLHEALQLWRVCADENGTASTLHELGVVHLRRADWTAATELLTQ